jgi:hypothetical protein
LAPDPQLVSSGATFRYFQHILNHLVQNGLGDEVLTSKHIEKPPVMFLYDIQQATTIMKAIGGSWASVGVDFSFALISVSY